MALQSVAESSAQGQVFAALADRTRRLLIDRLASGGPATATQLAGGLPISRQAVAKHLVQLQGAGLIRPDRPGRRARYDLRPGQLSDARRWLREIEDAWDRRLEALTRYVEDSG